MTAPKDCCQEARRKALEDAAKVAEDWCLKTKHLGTRGFLEGVANELRSRALLTSEPEALKGGFTEVPTGPDWACFECGYTGDGFRTVQHPAGDCDMECLECGSNSIDEACTVLRRLAEYRDTAEAKVETVCDQGCMNHTFCPHAAPSEPTTGEAKCEACNQPVKLLIPAAPRWVHARTEDGKTHDAVYAAPAPNYREEVERLETKAETLNRMWQDEKSRALAAEQDSARCRKALDSAKRTLEKIESSLWTEEMDSALYSYDRAALSTPEDKR